MENIFRKDYFSIKICQIPYNTAKTIDIVNGNSHFLGYIER